MTDLALASLDAIVERLAALQRCAENMRACVNAGDPNSILAASDELTRLVRSAADDGNAVQSLVASLGASSVPEAAHILCRRGERDASHSMMHLYALVIAIRRVQAQTAAFLRECLDTLDAASAPVDGRPPNGRLLGSA
ncbi:MAG TPA: hypothetical protein VF292_00840 [Rhodanobacteraceae bacterium]